MVCYSTPPVTRIFVSIIGRESDNASSIQSSLMFPIVDHVSDSRSCVRQSIMYPIIDFVPTSIAYQIVDRVFAHRGVILGYRIHDRLISDVRSLSGYMIDYALDAWPTLGYMIDDRTHDRLSDTWSIIGHMIDYRKHERRSGAVYRMCDRLLTQRCGSLGGGLSINYSTPQLPRSLYR